VLLERSSLELVRLSLAFAFIAGIMVLDSLEEVSTGARCRGSRARDDAISFLATCNSAVGEAAHAQPAWHKPIARTSSFSQAKE
jgi:hypothetical protein